MTTGLGVTYGLLSTGFVAPSLDVVRAEREADRRAITGASTPLGDNTYDGQQIAIEADREVAIWDLIQAVVASQDPDQATGAAEDAVCALTGTIRTAAKSSTVTETLTGTPGTVVAAGSQVKTASTSQVFATSANATITLLTSWAPTTAYTAGQRVTNTSRCYQCTVGGTSAGSGGPSVGTGTTTDGSVTWLFLGQGTGAVDVAAASLVQDAITAVAGDLTAIATPVGGWSSAYNVLDAVLGNVVETDEDLRLARENELAASGSDTDNAIRAALLETAGVTSATVFSNNTDADDGNGLAPHSVLALVIGGADADVAATLFANVGDGISTNTTTVIAGVSITVVTLADSEGVSQQVGFVRPTLVPIYARATLTYDATKYPSDGDTEVKAAVTNWAAGNGAGFNAVASAANAQVFTVAGVLDSTTLIYTDAIGAPVAWAATTAYVATSGTRSVVTNDGGRAYICTTGGTSAGSGGPSGVGSAIADGSVVWAFLGNTIAVDAFHETTWDGSRIAVASSAGSP